MVHAIKITIMKKIKIITQPVTLIICFLLILISGEHLGGFYLLYILLGLPHGEIHSVLAAAGIGILIFNQIKYKNESNYLVAPLLNISGLLLLILSLFLFFHNDRNHYNYSTFYQTVPLIIFGLFNLLAIVFLLTNLSKIKLRQIAT